MLNVLLTLSLLVVAVPAHAMHIAEGLLPLPWAGFWFACVAPFVALGLRRLASLSRDDLSMKPLVGLMAAVVFIISCMPVPVPTAGTCSHPCGTAIAAILVGPLVSVVVAAAAMLIQALFLAHGGLTTLGADIFSMGVVGSFAGWLVFRGMRSMGASLAVAALLAGVVTDWATYLATTVELASGIRGSAPFWPLAGKIALAFIPTQLPLGILEGAMTAGMVVLLRKKRPDLLVKMRVLTQDEVTGGRGDRLRTTGVSFLLLGLLFCAAGPAGAAGKEWKGVDEAVVEKVAAEHGRHPGKPLIDPGNGDILLFAFLVAGGAAGFAAGYYWRALTEKHRGDAKEAGKP